MPLYYVFRNLYWLYCTGRTAIKMEQKTPELLFMTYNLQQTCNHVSLLHNLYWWHKRNMFWPMYIFNVNIFWSVTEALLLNIWTLWGILPTIPQQRTLCSFIFIYFHLYTKIPVFWYFTSFFSSILYPFVFIYILRDFIFMLTFYICKCKYTIFVYKHIDVNKGCINIKNEYQWINFICTNESFILICELSAL